MARLTGWHFRVSISLAPVCQRALLRRARCPGLWRPGLTRQVPPRGFLVRRRNTSERHPPSIGIRLLMGGPR